jgi:phosphoenolpyruvate carboxylase
VCPTEVLRRTTSEKLGTTAELLRAFDERVLTADEHDALEAELRAEIVLLWQTNELYATAPTVQDEVRNLIARFREALFDEAPLLFERVEALLDDLAPIEASVRAQSGEDVVRPVSRLIRAVQLFGFRLYTLEWREHQSRVVDALDEIVADAIASLRAVAELRGRRGPDAVGSLILAGTESQFDVLSLLALGRACGALDAGPLQIVPLLESPTAREVRCESRTTGDRLHRLLLGADGAAVRGRRDERRLDRRDRAFRDRPEAAAASRRVGTGPNPA